MTPGKSPSCKLSPNLLKPSDLFKQRRKRKFAGDDGPRKKLFASPLKCIDFKTPEKNYKSPRTSRRKGTPRKTPVKTPRKTPRKTPKKTPQGKSPLTDRLIKTENELSKTYSHLFKSPRRSCTKRALVFATEESSVPLSALLDEDANIEPPTIMKKETIRGFPRIPIDWTLKTRLRFCSYKPFPFKGFFTATESATGTTSFVRCLSSSLSNEATEDVQRPNSPSSKSSFFSCIDNISATARLKKHCFIWRHPHLPGFDLFPRINNRCKLAPISKPMSEDLLHEYCSSLKDLFDLIKSRQCAYFYLCAYSFTALFQAPGVGGVDEIHVFITPTTEGFRKLLREEGIEFTMPLYEKEVELEKEKDKLDEEKEKACIEESVGSVVMDEDEDASNFLESLGVSLSDSASINKPKRTKSLAKRNVNSTLVMVKGPQAQDLIPFLSNTKIILTTTGSLAYVPPTLLAPVAFEGAQLHFLKLKQNNMSDKSTSMYSLEVRGPILPNMVDSLCELFRSTIGDFTANLVNYDYCTPLASVHSINEDNVDQSSKTIFASESLRDCGLGQQFIQDMCSKNNQSVSSYTMISCRNGRYCVK